MVPKMELGWFQAGDLNSSLVFKDAHTTHAHTHTHTYLSIPLRAYCTWPCVIKIPFCAHLKKVIDEPPYLSTFLQYRPEKKSSSKTCRSLHPFRLLEYLIVLCEFLSFSRQIMVTVALGARKLKNIFFSHFFGSMSENCDFLSAKNSIS